MTNPFSFKLGAEKVERLPCTHEWNLISKTYAAPRKDLATVSTPPTLEKALFGLTTYLWECRICSQLRKEEMLGSDQDQLTEIYEKIEREGMQYLKDGNNVYAIAKWVPSPDAVPVR